MAVRDPSHAGSWYSANETTLRVQLDRWLDAVPDTAACIGPVSSANGLQAAFPSDGARVIIAPHAGYSYSGKTAAWAYKAMDWSMAKRVFILGPSHHFYLTKCALSGCTAYGTPFGELQLDQPIISALRQTGLFDTMSLEVDEAEHSIEMQLPYLHKMLLREFSDYAASLPPIIPILVGNTSPDTERRYGELLAPYLSDPSTVFIISSDFAHWGSRFRYTYYDSGVTGTPPRSLKASEGAPRERPIHESIRAVDFECMAACEGGSVEAWWSVLEATGNTVCGRHPIGIIMAAMEAIRRERKETQAATAGDAAGTDVPADSEADVPAAASNTDLEHQFRFTHYSRSSECESPRDSSVSYASAFAVP